MSATKANPNRQLKATGSDTPIAQQEQVFLVNKTIKEMGIHALSLKRNNMCSCCTEGRRHLAEISCAKEYTSSSCSSGGHVFLCKSMTCFRKTHMLLQLYALRLHKNDVRREPKQRICHTTRYLSAQPDTTSNTRECTHCFSNSNCATVRNLAQRCDDC